MDVEDHGKSEELRNVLGNFVVFSVSLTCLILETNNTMNNTSKFQLRANLLNFALCFQFYAICSALRYALGLVFIFFQIGANDATNELRT